jgi:hypothetical protein
MDPDFVGAEDAATAGDELFEHLFLFRGLLFRGKFDEAIHGGLAS